VVKYSQQARKGKKQMANGILMPKAGISVESCIIGTWRKNVGDKIALGDILFDYETDKASFECESTAEGILLETFFENGDEVACLTVVCAVGQAGDDTSSLKPGSAAAPPISDTPAEILHTAIPIINTAPSAAPSDNNGAVSPRARGLADRMKIDLSSITPTGPRGRIIERDVLAAPVGRDLASASDELRNLAAAEGGALTAKPSADGYTDEKMSQIRKVIAKSMTKSLTELAQLTNHHSCDATAILGLRKRYKNNGAAMGLDGVSINDMVLFAVAKTLLSHPALNAHLLNGDTLRKFNSVHLGVAVETTRGLIVPTIFNADKLNLAQLSKAVKDLAAAAKSGNISPDLLQGATFTVSNLGSFGVEMFTPVVNPPQVAILGVCGTTAAVRDGGNGAVSVYQRMGLSITYDHRAIDGAPASRFARDLAYNIENIDLLLAL
jgi:pyruvate dehydrogenase E2 component (dihydrolipoamide acetyltransferase)